MKTRNRILFILLLFAVGAAGRFFVAFRQHQENLQFAEYQETYHQQTQEYLEMYQKWSRLSAEEKTEYPWGQDPYGGPEIRNQLQQNQQERLLADLPDLVSGSGCPTELGNILYGPTWQDAVSAYRKKSETREILSLVSVVLMISAGGVGGLYLSYWAVKAAQILYRKVRKSPAGVIKSNPKSQIREITDEISQAAEPEICAVPDSSNEEAYESSEEDSPSLGYFESFQRSSSKRSSPAVFSRPSGGSTDAAAATQLCLKDAEETIEEITESMVSSLMTPEPASKELTELTEQMSAIRQYAAEQQSHMRKLQDGYDWLIIKRFCLRIIRCIDNIEDRIQMICDEKDPSMLQDIRDELMFALESSGVEPFEPELDRDYRGLEKYAEAVKDRFENDDPEMTGKIAEIVRPGYQYLINDEEVKIVRCAQVKLYA